MITFICDYLVSEETARPSGARGGKRWDHRHPSAPDLPRRAYAIPGSPASRRSIAIFAYETTPPRRGAAASPTPSTWRSMSPRPTSSAETRNVEGLAASRELLLRGAHQRLPARGRRVSCLPRTCARRSVRQGFRRVLHVVADDLSESRDVSREIDGSPEPARPFDLCVRPDQIDKAIALADLAPDVQFVLDHCGVPDDQGPRRAPWREQHRGDRAAAQCRGQDLRRRRLRRRPRLDRSTTSGPTSNTRSQASAGIASSGAATGRSAR